MQSVGGVKTFQYFQSVYIKTRFSFSVPVCADNCMCGVPGKCDDCKTGFFKNTPNDADKTTCGGRYNVIVLKCIQ